jgi:E3 ubiquitin-protein ligase listerin
MTIIAAITATGAEPPKLDRYRNELAASLLGIKPHRANTEGLLALRKLAASAPDPDGDVVFLTSPRAVNVVKACQGWVLAADDDDGEEMEERVESAMLSIFMHLAPILQNVPGGHWGFVFDVLEGVLEGASVTDEKLEEEAGEEGEELVALTRALRLVLVLEELATRNKSLMAEWEGRRMGVLVIIRDLNVLGLGMLTFGMFKKNHYLMVCTFRLQILRMYLLYLVPHVVNLCCQLSNTFLRR